MPSTAHKLETALYRRMKDTVFRYDLLAEGDRVMVAVSGGKDSYTLLQLLARLQKRLPFAVNLVAVHLDQQQPGYDGTPLADWFRTSGVHYEILREDTYSVVTDRTKEGGTYCALCSRLRRGILYSAAERLGCNKIALGHHREDAIETFLLNLFYAGKLQAMPASYETNDGAFQVIRPLIETGEKEIAAFAEVAAFPILPCNLCGSQEGLKRPAMKRLIEQLETSNPHVRNIILAALGNVRPSHLLDTDVQEAWAVRPEHIQKTEPAARRTAHAGALPIETGGALVGTAPGKRPLPIL